MLEGRSDCLARADARLEVFLAARLDVPMGDFRYPDFRLDRVEIMSASASLAAW
jgi:hypothetical protein